MLNENKATFSEKYSEIRPLYSRLCDEVADILRSKIRAFNAVTITKRVKSAESFVSKTERKSYENPLTDITDLAGVRIVCNYETDQEGIIAAVQSQFDVADKEDVSGRLGIDKMGYNGTHLVVRLGSRYSEGRYDGITSLPCEIQVRTVLQDAWATISHQLIYKSQQEVPDRLKRDLNNVASLLEIAQGVFDASREKIQSYVKEIEDVQSNRPNDFLSQDVDLHTLLAYARWKFPDLQPSDKLTGLLLRDLDLANYKSLNEIDSAVKRAEKAVAAYREVKPALFQNSTDFITKSLGFIDQDFRKRHGFSHPTQEAFKTYRKLIAP